MILFKSHPNTLAQPPSAPLPPLPTPNKAAQGKRTITRRQGTSRAGCRPQRRLSQFLSKRIHRFRARPEIRVQHGTVVLSPTTVASFLLLQSIIHPSALPLLSFPILHCPPTRSHLHGIIEHGDTVTTILMSPRNSDRSPTTTPTHTKLERHTLLQRLLLPCYPGIEDCSNPEGQHRILLDLEMLIGHD